MEFLKLLVFVLVLANVDSLDCDCVEKILSECKKPPVPTIIPRKTTPKPNDPECTKTVADIFFVLDESSSIKTEPNFKKELEFVISVVDFLDVEQGKTQVGAITFSNDSKLEFPLNQYSTRIALAQAIRKIHWDGGDTYLGKALRLLREYGLKTAYGARQNVPHIAVIITDGVQHDPRETRLELNRLRADYKLFAIGVGPERNTKGLNLIAGDPSRVFEVDDVEGLQQIRKSLSTRLCDQGISFGDFNKNRNRKPKPRSFSLK